MHQILIFEKEEKRKSFSNHGHIYLVEYLNQAIALGFLSNVLIPNTQKQKLLRFSNYLVTYLSRTYLRNILEVQLTAFEIVRESDGKEVLRILSPLSYKLKL